MRIFDQLGPNSTVSGEFRRAPVAQWQPQHCGKMDLKIDRQGIWWHEGKPIRRASLVKVLASVLTYEEDQWCLKSPIEKMYIEVEDAPFVITDFDLIDRGIALMTNVGETCILEAPWRLTLDPDGEWRPWIELHEMIGARLSRPLLLRLIDEALTQNPNPTGDTLFLEAADFALALGKIST